MSAGYTANSGHAGFADQVLAPLGLLARYRGWLAELNEVGLPLRYSVTAPTPAREAELDALARKVQAPHRYRWSDPAAMRGTLRADLAALLRGWDLTAYSADDRYLRATSAAAFDERGFRRSWP